MGRNLKVTSYICLSEPSSFSSQRLGPYVSAVLLEELTADDGSLDEVPNHSLAGKVM